MPHDRDSLARPTAVTGGRSAPAPTVSVVVATRDRATRLASLLESLRRQTLASPRFEVVVVDDGSRDGTQDLLRRERERGGLGLEALARSRGQGPARARNAGWRAARAPIVAFTDDDCEATPSWLAEGLRACERDPQAIVQGRTVPIPREGDRMGAFSRTQVVERLGPYFQTCNIFYPRALLERLGGFDERFTLSPGGEDTDLAWRALESGVRAVFCEEALVHHAVEDLGPLGLLRVAARWSDTMYTFRRHPGLRRQVLSYGLFWKRSHALLSQAVVGLVLARRRRPAALLAVPYARHLAERCAAAPASGAYAPYFALHDLVEIVAAIRGAVRHRVLVV